MKQFKHKLSSSQEKEITALATGLPAMAQFDRAGRPVYKKTAVHGSVLILNGDKTDHQGNKIHPETLYQAPILQYVNHKAKMIEVFKSAGMEGVVTYCEEVLDQKKRMDEEMASRNPWYVKLFKWLKLKK